ncbi:MAG: hypothetical protein ABSD64_13430 [Terriglobales bacterium]|jgi:hypothetical protein
MFYGTFNGSVWHAFWVLFLLWLLIYFLVLYSLPKGLHYLFDPKHNLDRRLRQEAGSYEPHIARYQDLSKIIITLSAASIAFLVNTLTNDKPAPSAFSLRIQTVAPIVIGFFGFSIAMLVAFAVIQSICYEAYCHSADHCTYKRWKYALNMSLGFTGLLSFAIGFVWLAHNLFN